MINVGGKRRVTKGKLDSSDVGISPRRAVAVAEAGTSGCAEVAASITPSYLESITGSTGR